MTSYIQKMLWSLKRWDEVPEFRMLAKLPLTERSTARSFVDDSSVMAQDKSSMYVSGVGEDDDMDDTDGVKAITASPSCQFSFPFGFEPCPSIPPPLAKQ